MITDYWDSGGRAAVRIAGTRTSLAASAQSGVFHEMFSVCSIFGPTALQLLLLALMMGGDGHGSAAPIENQPHAGIEAFGHRRASHVMPAKGRPAARRAMLMPGRLLLHLRAPMASPSLTVSGRQVVRCHARSPRPAIQMQSASDCERGCFRRLSPTWLACADVVPDIARREGS